MKILCSGFLIWIQFFLENYSEFSTQKNFRKMFYQIKERRDSLEYNWENSNLQKIIKRRENRIRSGLILQNIQTFAVDFLARDFSGKNFLSKRTRYCCDSSYFLFLKRKIYTESKLKFLFRQHQIKKIQNKKLERFFFFEHTRKL